MTVLTTTTPPAVVQAPDERMSDLASDLRAVGGYQTSSAPAGALTRPAILRRIGALLAGSVPPGTDRIVCHSDDALIGVAVSLHTGIPVAVVHSNRATTGELHRTENVVAVGYSDVHGRSVAEQVEDIGGTIVATAVVFGAPDDSRPAHSSLFASA